MQELMSICKRKFMVYRLRLRIAMLMRALMKQARTTTEALPLRELQALDILRGPACWMAPNAVEREVRQIQRERGLS